MVGLVRDVLCQHRSMARHRGKARHPVIIGGGVLLVAALGVGGAYAAMNGGDATPPATGAGSTTTSSGSASSSTTSSGTTSSGTSSGNVLRQHECQRHQHGRERRRHGRGRARVLRRHGAGPAGAGRGGGRIGAGLGAAHRRPAQVRLRRLHAGADQGAVGRLEGARASRSRGIHPCRGGSDPRQRWVRRAGCRRVRHLRRGGGEAVRDAVGVAGARGGHRWRGARAVGDPPRHDGPQGAHQRCGLPRPVGRHGRRTPVLPSPPTAPPRPPSRRHRPARPDVEPAAGRQLTTRRQSSASSARTAFSMATCRRSGLR